MATYTVEQIGARAKQRNPEALGKFSDAEIGQRLVDRKPELKSLVAPSVARPQVAAPAVPEEQKQPLYQRAIEGIKNVGIGELKGLGSTIAGASALGEKIVGAPARALGLVPKDEVSLGKQIQESGMVTPEGTAQTLGFGIEQAGEFFLPGGAVGRAAKAIETGAGIAKAAEGAGLLTRAAQGAGRLATRSGLEALTVGGQTALQTGGDLKKTAEAAAVGAAFPVAVAPLKGLGKLAQKSAGESAERLINSLIKPLQRDFAYGKNPGRGVAREGIVANSFDDLIGKVTQKREQLGKEIGAKLKANAKKKVSLNGTMAPIDEAIAKAKEAPETNAAIIERLKALKRDLRLSGGKAKTVSPQEAFDFKQKVADLTRFTGNHSDDKEVNMALKRVYGNVKERINGVVPKVKNLNERFADIKSAEVAAKYRDKIMERQNVIPLSAKMAGGVGGAIMGGAPGAAIGILASTGIEKVLASSLLKTRVAKALMTLSAEERALLAAKNPLIKAFMDRVF